VPFALHRTQAAQQELAEALYLLDDAEDGLDPGLALGVARLAVAMFNAPRESSMVEQRRSREQWRELIRGWPGSGLTQALYCERHGISTGSLSRWRAVFGREHQAGGGQARSRAEAPLRLLPVAFSQALEPPRSDRVLPLVFGGGVRLEVDVLQADLDFLPVMGSYNLARRRGG
jgi:hypothetical protein